jgi:hypothetical protein
VHFESENGARAAVIVEVFSDDFVSLRVFGATNEEGVAKLYTSVKRGTGQGEWHPYDEYDEPVGFEFEPADSDSTSVSGNTSPEASFEDAAIEDIEEVDEDEGDESEPFSSPKSSKSSKK